MIEFKIQIRVKDTENDLMAASGGENLRVAMSTSRPTNLRELMNLARDLENVMGEELEDAATDLCGDMGLLT